MEEILFIFDWKSWGKSYLFRLKIPEKKLLVLTENLVHRIRIKWKYVVFLNNILVSRKNKNRDFVCHLLAWLTLLAWICMSSANVIAKKGELHMLLSLNAEIASKIVIISNVREISRKYAVAWNFGNFPFIAKNNFEKYSDHEIVKICVSVPCMLKLENEK